MLYNKWIEKLGIFGKQRIMVAGSFGVGTTGVAASYSQAVAAGGSITIAATATGTAGNSLDYESVADGTATPSLSIAIGTDTLTVTHATAGTSKNGLKVYLVPGGTAGAEVATEDASGNLMVSYQASTSTTTQISAAIDGHANWVSSVTGTEVTTGLKTGTLSGGTDPTWAEVATTPTKLVLHYTDAVTTKAAAKVALDAVGTAVGYTVTVVGTTTLTLASGDATGGKVDLSGGVTAVAAGAVRGKGFSVATKATGYHTITFDSVYPHLIDFKACLQLATAADQFVIPCTYTKASKTIDIALWDKSATNVADITAGANNRINFLAIFSNSPTFD